MEYWYYELISNYRPGIAHLYLKPAYSMLEKINWSDVPAEEVTSSMTRKIITGEKLMIAKMKFKDGFLVPLHHHVHEQITQVISGQIRFWFGENKEQVMDLFGVMLWLFHPIFLTKH